jgi:hypothetical protein
VNASGKIYFQNLNLNKTQSECPPGFSDYNNNNYNCSCSTIHNKFGGNEDNRNNDYTNNHIHNIRNDSKKFDNVDRSFDIQHVNESYAGDGEQHNYPVKNENLIDQGFKTHHNQDKKISKHHCNEDCIKLNHRDDESDNYIVSDMDIHNTDVRVTDIDTVKKNIVNSIYYDISVHNYSKGKAYLDPLVDDDFDHQQMF